MAARRKSPLPPPCIPTGDLFVREAPTGICVGMPGVCEPGAPLHAVPCGENDWTWVDEQNRPHIDYAPKALRDDPVKWWADLAERNIGLYSLHLCRTTLGQWTWFHIHRQDMTGWRDRPIPAKVPECCGGSMQHVPNSWRCRESGQRFPFTSTTEKVML